MEFHRQTPITTKIPFTLSRIAIEKTEPDFIIERLASSVLEIEIHFVLEDITY